MGKIWRSISNVVAALVIISLAFGGGYYIGQLQDKEAKIVENEEPEFDLQLPVEVEKRIVTVEEITVKLEEISQFSTYSGEYTVSKSADYTRYFLDDIPVPGTTNTITIECSGIVKVGYDVQEIIPTVDNESQRIYVSLPEPSVLDNYVMWDRVHYSDENNILNPIDFAQYQKLIAEIEDMGLAQAEAEGIYKAAEKNIKVIIENFLAGFEDYKIVFM